MYMCVYVRDNAYICMRMCTYLCGVCVCVCERFCICECVSVCVCVYNMYVYVYVYVYVNAKVDMDVDVIVDVDVNVNADSHTCISVLKLYSRVASVFSSSTNSISAARYLFRSFDNRASRFIFF